MLDLLERDITFPMAYEPGWQDYGHHASVEEYRDRIVKEVQIYERSGIWEYWDPTKESLQEFAAFLNQCLVVVRFPDDGKGRLSFSNSCLLPQCLLQEEVGRHSRVCFTAFRCRELQVAVRHLEAAPIHGALQDNLEARLRTLQVRAQEETGSPHSLPYQRPSFPREA